jgi:glycosyltransferase involved in cell wall biosynthesis
MAERRLKVLAVYSFRNIWSMGEGYGVPAFFLALTAFPRHGHEIHVLLPGRPGCVREELYHGVHLHRFPSRIDFMPYTGRNRLWRHVRVHSSYVWWFVRSVPAALRLARRVEPDVTYGMGELGAVTARIVGRRRGIPNVTRLFGSTLALFLKRPWRMIPRYREVLAFRTPAARYVFCENGSEMREVARFLGVPESRMRIWLDGVDRSRFRPAVDAGAARAALGLPRDHTVVLSVSRLHPEKHVERLVAAAPRVLAAHRRATFLIAGDGEERAALETTARELGVDAHVRFLGAVRHDDLPGIYAAADVLVALSDRTNLSNSVLEAMCCGLPVVAVDAGGTGKVVTQGATGVLLARENVTHLPEALVDLLSAEEHRHAMGRRARETAERLIPDVAERQALEVGAVLEAMEEGR